MVVLVVQIVFPLAFILVFVRVDIFSIPIGLVVFELSLIDVHITVIESAFAVSYAISPVSFILRPIWPVLQAVPVPNQMTVFVLPHLARIHDPFSILSHERCHIFILNLYGVAEVYFLQVLYVYAPKNLVVRGEDRISMIGVNIILAS